MNEGAVIDRAIDYDIATPEAIDEALHSGALQSATFAMGCFWGPDASLGRLPGVVQTRVGYAGGLGASPNYGHVQDHAEAVRVVFRQEDLPYDALLDEYAMWFSPTAGHYDAGQYRALLITHTPAHFKQAEEYAAQAWGYEGPKILAPADPRATFWAAEPYHQKHRLRRNAGLVSRLAEELGPRWDEHLWATKLNALGERNVDKQLWLNRVPLAIKEAYRRG